MKITYKRLKNGHALGWVAGRVRVPVTNKSLLKAVFDFPGTVAWVYWSLLKRRMGWKPPS